MSVAVAICTRSGGPGLAQTLGHLVDELDPSTPLLIVRNDAVEGRFDAATERAITALSCSTSVITLPSGPVARSRQAALDHGESDVLVFADDDIRAAPGWLAALAAPFADGSVGAVGGSILPVFPDGTTPAWLPDRLGVAYGARDAADPNASHRPFGANMAVRRAAARAVGGFDDLLGHEAARPGMHEETELCERMAAAGWRIADAPAAVVEHCVRPDQVHRRWILRRAAGEGRSDARRDRGRARRPIADLGSHAAKLTGLVVASPVLALLPRARWYWAGRIVVNAAYLAERARRRTVSRAATVEQGLGAAQ